MKFLKTLLEMTRDEHEAELRNAYGSTGHPKAQSQMNDFDGGVGGGYTDEYSSTEWAGDWCNDHKEEVAKLLPFAYQSDYESLESELEKYFEPTASSRHQAAYYAACIADYLVDKYATEIS